MYHTAKKQFDSVLELLNSVESGRSSQSKMQYLSLEEHTIMTNHSLKILKIERDEIEKINQEQ